MRHTTRAGFRAVIAGADSATRQTLRSLLAEHRDCALVGEVRTGDEMLTALATLQPELLFLDQQLTNLDGVQLLRVCGRQRLPAVIFVGMDQPRGLSVFAARAEDYLRKPIDRHAFQRALHWVRRTRSAPPLAVSIARDTVLVEPHDIDCIRAMGYYAMLHVRGRGHLLRESLTSLSRRLDASMFVRVHRSAIVNVRLIHALSRAATGDTVLVLRDGTKIPVSRRRRGAVNAMLRRFAS